MSSQRRKQITIDPSRVRAPGPGGLVDFPVLFSVEDPDLAARASAGGSDIYFTDSDGETGLAHEIEKWNRDTGELVAWVEVPALSAAEDTVFYIYYGDPDAASQVDPAEVWSSDFAGVWHMAESPELPMPGGIRDSTTGNDGTAHESMQVEDLVAGQIGDAIDFDGIDDEITFENPITGTTPHTISAWVSQRATGSQDALVVLGNGVQNEARWLHSAWFGGTVAVGFYSNDWNTGIDIQDGGWTLLHWTHDDTGSRMYVDGALADEHTSFASGIDTQGSEGRIGNAPPAFGEMMNLAARVDEVRIATVARSAEWIETAYENQSDPTGFYTVGAEEP